MNRILYDAIPKRKSFHNFRGVGDETLDKEALERIVASYRSFPPLYPEIKTAIRIVPAEKTSCKVGAEYCVLFYSEKKDGWLQNIGYLGEQLDLRLVSENVGTLWFGLGKTKEADFEGLEFAIMMAIRKVDDPARFREDMYKCKRKAAEDIWSGEPLGGVTDLVRFAPSACNSQPWLVRNEDGRLRVFRKKGKMGIIPVPTRFNQIDIGIFLCFLELCLEHEEISFERNLFPAEPPENGLFLNAEYQLR
ncbi:MAG: nitroreductase [Oscillospiraceae bacterium]|nr:nitroreductase [Oscillospiraceae bacterium]